MTDQQQPSTSRAGIATFSTNMGRRTSPNPRRIAYIVRGVERRAPYWVYDVAFADADRNLTGALTIEVRGEASMTPRVVLKEYELGFFDNLHNEALGSDLMMSARSHVSFPALPVPVET